MQYDTIIIYLSLCTVKPVYRSIYIYTVKRIYVLKLVNIALIVLPKKKQIFSEVTEEIN